MAAVQVPGAAEQFVAHARPGVGGAQHAQHPLGAVRPPVDPAVLLPQHGPGPAHGLRPGQVGAGGEAVHGEQDGLQGRVGDLPRYQALLDCGGTGTGQATVAHTSPASISALAWSTVTPHRAAPSWTARSREDGPRSPTGPGWTMRQVWADHTSSGRADVSIGATSRSGR